MQNITKQMCIAQLLEKHPMLHEDFSIKKNYFEVLQNIKENLNISNDFSDAVINLYKVKLFKNQNYIEERSCDASKITLNLPNDSKQLKSKLFALITDSLIINSSFNKKDTNIVCSEMRNHIEPKHQRYLNKLFRLLFTDKNKMKAPKSVKRMLANWQKNITFLNSRETKILITANMSAGKSTLVNSIIGKVICQTKNDACTAKLHCIQNKPFEDKLIYEFDHQLELDATHNILMDNNELNKTATINVATYFRTNSMNQKKITLIDTPGVNSSQNIDHRTLTEEIIECGDYDKIIYVINGEQIGTDDDRRHLEFIANTVKAKEIIFVLNKLDKFRHGEDDIKSSILSIKKELSEIGFENATICPVSAYAGLLAKKKLYGDVLNEDDIDDLNFFVRKFKRVEYDLSQYSSKENQDYGKAIINSSKDENERKMLSLLDASGMFSLEGKIYK